MSQEILGRRLLRAFREPIPQAQAHSDYERIKAHLEQKYGNDPELDEPSAKKEIDRPILPIWRNSSKSNFNTDLNTWLNTVPGQVGIGVLASHSLLAGLLAGGDTRNQVPVAHQFYTTLRQQGNGSRLWISWGSQPPNLKETCSSTVTWRGEVGLTAPVPEIGGSGDSRDKEGSV